MTLVAEGSVDVQTVLVLGVLGQGLADPVVRHALHRHTAGLHLHQRGEDGLLHEGGHGIVRQAGLVLVQRGGVDLGASLSVHQQDPEHYDRTEHGLSVLPGQIHVCQPVLPPAGGAPLQRETVRGYEELPRFRLEILTGHGPLIVLELPAEGAELVEYGRIIDKILPLQILPPALDGQHHHPAGRDASVQHSGDVGLKPSVVFTSHCSFRCLPSTCQGRSSAPASPCPACVTA